MAPGRAVEGPLRSELFSADQMEHAPGDGRVDPVSLSRFVAYSEKA